MLDASRPFVLLDDAAGGGAARLYRDPADVIVARTPADVVPALDALRAATAAGRHAAGYLAYEAGAPLVGPRGGHAAAPLLWFGLFDGVERIAAADVPALLPDPAGGWAGVPVPRIDRAAYDAAIARVLAYIAAGDIYQANLTFRADVAVAGSPLALYARLRARSAAGWGGIVFTGERWLLSASPELFVAVDADGRLTARPMKGTAARGADAAAEAAALAADPKQRAENLMIVDLLRNDLARVARAGSVRVPALFAVETYPTLHQMTSTVTADLAEGRDAIDLIAAAFPCGSVTGAPKRRAMEVIAEVEAGPRGPYTGSIGHVAPDGSAAFNVAIRTIDWPAGQVRATLGLGSGIVADSVAADEWAECKAKGAFVGDGSVGFDLIETMRFDAMEGLERLDRHMARLRAACTRFGFAVNHHDLRNELQAATFRLRDDARVRLRVSPAGAVAIEVTALPPAPDGPVKVAVVPLPVPADDLRLSTKTSDRAFYDAPRIAAGTFEVAFYDAHGFLTEGSFTNLFVDGGGVLLTPPLGRGLLPGVLRAELIDSGRAVEADLTADDLVDGFLIGNALRGLMPARLVAAAARPRL
ncbi:MAG: aminodeoxychorismate synthase component I [Sphingomonas fennica]